VTWALVKLPRLVDAGTLVVKEPTDEVAPPDDEDAPPLDEVAPPVVEEAPAVDPDAPPVDVPLEVSLPPQPTAKAKITAVPRLSSRTCLIVYPSLFAPWRVRGKVPRRTSKPYSHIQPVLPREIAETACNAGFFCKLWVAATICTTDA
jgi:hypothetical protein